MEAETTDIPVENRHRHIRKERTLASFDNGMNKITGIMRGRGIRSRRYGRKGNIWAGVVLGRG